MTIRFRWAMSACVLAMGLTVLLVCTESRYHEDQQRLVFWKQSAPPTGPVWSVAQWRRVLHASSLPMPELKQREKQLTVRWSSAQAQKVLPLLSAWLLRSSWRIVYLHVSNHKVDQSIELTLAF